MKWPPLGLLALLLAACAQIGGPSSGDGPGLDPGTPLVPGDSTPEISDAPIPDLEWVRDPSMRVILGSFCCGLTTPAYITNYIPEFQVWGDGRFIWTVQEDGSRRVFSAHLSPDQVDEMLLSAAQDGFFGWQDRYEDPLVTDLADKCIRISLAVQEKSVCEYHRGAPDAFHRLFERLATGAGMAGQEFSPEIGLVRAKPLDSQLPEPQLRWEYGDLPLSAIGEDGQWMEGEALQVLWRVVNTFPWSPIVEDGGRSFELTLQVPGVSLRDPRAR